MLIAITVGAKNRQVENRASRKPRMRHPRTMRAVRLCVLPLVPPLAASRLAHFAFHSVCRACAFYPVLPYKCRWGARPVPSSPPHTLHPDPH
jgi:hypothetical protein